MVAVTLGRTEYDAIAIVTAYLQSSANRDAKPATEILASVVTEYDGSDGLTVGHLLASMTGMFVGTFRALAKELWRVKYNKEITEEEYQQLWKACVSSALDSTIDEEGDSDDEGRDST